MGGTVQNTEVPGLAHIRSLEGKVFLPKMELHQPLGAPPYPLKTFLCSPPQPRQRESYVLQKLLLSLGWVKLGLLGLICNNAISISFLSKAQKSCEWLGPILEFHLGFDSRVYLDPCL